MNINVTKPFLPSLEEFIPYLEKIWENKCLTNNGSYHVQFEKELAEVLGVKYVSLFCNGTIALIAALRALRITGEVITTPFSFVATTHSLRWNGIKPVFVDIEPDYYNIDPNKIEASITPKTTAILPVHVYGNPCYIVRIQEIADIYGLKVIYDAAHAFGVSINGNSICNFGDLSVLSFHATKVFNTFEGGAIISHDIKLKKRIDLLKNFGFANETMVIAYGINGKMNEFQSALGILQLKYFDEVIEKRKFLVDLYRQKLHGIKGIKFLEDIQNIKHNNNYFPIFINKTEFGKSRNEIYKILKNNNIFTRRYFYPLISRFPIYRGLESARPDLLPVAEKAASEVLCLPLYPDLKEGELNKIIDIIK